MEALFLARGLCFLWTPRNVMGSEVAMIFWVVTILSCLNMSTGLFWLAGKAGRPGASGDLALRWRTGSGLRLASGMLVDVAVELTSRSTLSARCARGFGSPFPDGTEASLMEPGR